MKILWLKTELLHPVDKGGKIRTYNMLRELKRQHWITYLTLDDESDLQARSLASEYSNELIRVPHTTQPKFSVGFYGELAANLFSPLPYFMNKYKSQEMRRAVEEQVAGHGFDVLVCDFLQPSINVPDKLPLPSLLFQHNVEAMIWKRHCDVQTNPLKRAYLKTQWQKAVAYERRTCQRFDLVVAVSPEDSQTMASEYHVQNVTHVPTGVDTEYFRPRGHVAARPRSLVFTGSMDWLPNEDAMQYFIKEVLPLVRRGIPDVTLTIVGRSPYASLLDLSRRDPNIIVAGRVDDVRPYIEEAAAYIVPIRIGGGTRLKIYEAMAMEKPVISTSIGAEGLPVRDGVELLLADSPSDFADAIERVTNDHEVGQRLGKAAAEVVREKFAWSGVAQKFSDLCELAVENYRAKSSGE